MIGGDDQQYKIILDLEAEDKGHRNWTWSKITNTHLNIIISRANKKKKLLKKNEFSLPIWLFA